MGVGSEEVIAPSKGTRIRYPLQNEIKKIERNPKIIFENILKHAQKLFCDVVIFGQKKSIHCPWKILPDPYPLQKFSEPYMGQKQKYKSNENFNQQLTFQETFAYCEIPK